MVASPWRTNTDAEYDAACRRCEVWVTISDKAQLVRVRRCLRYDKRDGGSAGRALNADVPELGLLAHDRIEPTQSLRDVGDFDKLSTFPVRVLFWRVSSATLCHRRFPLFDEALGITPTTVIALDLLHTLYLGVMQSLCKTALWHLLVAPVWGVTSANAPERIVLHLLRLRSQLMDWYSSRARMYPDEHLTQVADLTIKMLGSESNPKLRTKAMETYGIMLYLIDALERHERDLPPCCRALREAAIALERFIQICKRHGSVLPASAQQEPSKLNSNVSISMMVHFRFARLRKHTRHGGCLDSAWKYRS